MNARRAFHTLERVEQRVLGALRCIDAATGSAIDGTLDIATLDAPAARLVRNRSGLIVIHEWPPLADHASAFEQAPALPAVGSQTLRLAIRDPAGRYLPRIVGIALPRAPADALFLPREVALYPAASAATGANWSLLRISVADTVSGDPLGGALLRVIRNGVVLARGLSDGRGEALVAVVGVPVTTFSEDENAVVVSRIEVSLDACWDPRPGLDSSGLRTPLAALRDGRQPPATPLIDPESLEAAALADLDPDAPILARAALSLSIAARETLPRRLTITVPP
jgi:hypothetical protein